MTDAAKRELIRFLNQYDHLAAKGSPYKSQKVHYEEQWEQMASDELDEMSGKDLTRELWRQILYTLPVALFLLMCVAAAVWVLVAG